MIPGSVGTGRELLIDSDASDHKPIGAGPLTGHFSNKDVLLVASVSFFVLSAVLFASSYFMSRDEASQMANPGPDRTAQAFWALGWISGVAGFLFLVLSVYIWREEKNALETAMFKDEPRDYDFNPVGPRQPEVIKVRCRYCGTLNGVQEKNCTACGATL
jgi:hypothetical protein